MTTYETVFIMNPVLSDDQVKETVKKFVDQIKANKGKITNEENWGLKKWTAIPVTFITRVRGTLL